MHQAHRIARQAHLGGKVQPHHPRVRITVHQRLRGLRQGGKGVVLAGHIVQPRAQGQDQITAVKTLQLLRRIGQTQIAHKQRVAVGKDIVPAKGHRHGHMPGLGKGQQGFATAGHIEGASGDDEGTLGTGEQGSNPIKSLGTGAQAIVGACTPSHGFHQWLLHIFGQGNHHGARRATGGHAHRLVSNFGQLRRIGGFKHPLGNSAVHGTVIDLLKGLAPQILLRHLPHHQNERNGVLLCRVHRNAGVGGPGASTHHHHAGSAREASIGTRHEACARLVTASHQIDLRKVGHRIEQTDVALAGHLKNTVHAVRGQHRNKRMRGSVQDSLGG